MGSGKGVCGLYTTGKTPTTSGTEGTRSGREVHSLFVGGSTAANHRRVVSGPPSSTAPLLTRTGGPPSPDLRTETPSHSSRPHPPSFVGVPLGTLSRPPAVTPGRSETRSSPQGPPAPPGSRGRPLDSQRPEPLSSDSVADPPVTQDP